MMIKSQADGIVAAGRRENIKKVTTTDKLGAIINKNGAYSDRSSVELNLGSYTAQKIDDVDPTDFIDNSKFRKRDFLLQLFREYNDFPIHKCLSNFAKVYNDVFLGELPSVVASYALLEVQIVEIPNIHNLSDPL